MFSLKSFKIRQERGSYPRFSKVIQSWYSPFVGNKKQDDAGMSACVSLAVYKNDTSGKSNVLLVSAVNGTIPDSTNFREHIKCLHEDYLNKTNVVKASLRQPDAIVFESKFGEHNPFLVSLDELPVEYFYPEHNGGELLDQRVNVMMPYLKDVFSLTRHPVNDSLRPDDAELVGMLSAYPSPESYAMTSAFVQGMLYLAYCGVFEPEVPPSKINSEFY